MIVQKIERLHFWSSFLALIVLVSTVMTISLYAAETECLFSGTNEDGERTPYGWCWNDVTLEGYLMSCEGTDGICSQLDCLDDFPCVKLVGPTN